jgi:hypothetical protein
VTKENKSVLLLSSMHHDNKGDIKTGKPKRLLTLLIKYATNTRERGTRRWSLCVFYGMIDICAINA